MGKYKAIIFRQLFLYFCFAFANWSICPNDWGVINRTFFVIIIALSTIPIDFYKGLFKQVD